ncbi:MAG: Wzt carbohydrate-binding domain-containing protein [Synechococcus sp.]
MATGEPIRVCQDYYSFTATQECINADCDTTPLVPQHETGSARFISLMLKSEYPLDASNTVSQGESLGLQFELEAIENLEDLVFAISIYATDGTWMIGQTSLDEGVKSPGIASGRTIIGQICFDTLYLSPGDYQACIGAYSKDLSILYALTDLHLAFSVRASIPRWGKYYQPCRWTLTESQ